ncbi:MAG: DivIVA domain-containing protein [Nitrospirae bacterium]|nr:DivIVA domain-containing protein [Nitrospirota bacterium]
MRITPLDIQQKQFPMRFRGFHAEEVFAFLEAIREEIEDLLRENAQLRERLQQTDDESRRFWEMQDLLGRTLQEAHQMSEEYKGHARKESDQLLQTAAEEAEELVGRSHEQILALNEEIVELRMVRKRFHVEMKEVIGRFMRLLDGESSNRKQEFSLHSLHGTGAGGDLPEDPSENSCHGSVPED